MKFTIYQLLAPLFAIFMIISTLSSYRRGEKTAHEFFGWAIIWGGIIYVSLKPDIVTYFAEITGLESGINALIFTGFLVLFYIVFKLVVIVEKLERDITTVVREVALRGLNKTPKKLKKNSKR